MKVHLGCGRRVISGWFNVDKNPPADLMVDIRLIDFAESSIEEVMTIHFIEHLAREDAISLLGRVYKWLRGGGKLSVECPCRDRIIELMKTDIQSSAWAILGGRKKHDPGWIGWIKENADKVCSTFVDRPTEVNLMVPVEYSGTLNDHLHIWSLSEMSEVLKSIGFRKTKSRIPEFHGQKDYRDFRIEALK